jgi:GNAT superfamily N-acetyltransferase
VTTTLRRAEPTDVPALLDITREGFETYREFAPAGWEPPDMQNSHVVAIEDVATWFVADEAGEPIGHVLLIPAARSREPVDDPRLGHVMQLFVRRSHWGTGVASELHAAMLEEAVGRGFTELRLLTPAEQHRARRFYEREGWRLWGERDDPGLGFAVVEYRRSCPTPS